MGVAGLRSKPGWVGEGRSNEPIQRGIELDTLPQPVSHSPTRFVGFSNFLGVWSRDDYLLRMDSGIANGGIRD